jgi:hypothetical protein
MAGTHKTYVCKLDQDDEEKALDFELDFQQSLSTAERFTMMFQVSNKIKEMLIRNGYRRPSEIIKRT